MFIADAAAAQETDVFFSTSSEEDSKFEPSQVFIHPYANERDVLSLIPENIEAFVNLGKETGVLKHIVEGFEDHNTHLIESRYASTRPPRDNIDQVSTSEAEIKKLDDQTSSTVILN
ncbi:hypothetical protein TrVFT333_007497 [Trichoderma virens FT-333]|nr:hypothetical protein TrVFT333_007497 [Trichoderma virens FT-333]